MTTERYKVYEYRVPAPSWEAYERSGGGGGEGSNPESEEHDGFTKQEKEGGGGSKSQLVLVGQSPAAFGRLPYRMPSTLVTPKAKRIWRDVQCLYLLVERVHHHYAAQIGNTRAPKLLKLCQKWLSQEPKDDDELIRRSASPLARFNLLTDKGKAASGQKVYTAMPTCELVCPLTGATSKHDVTKRPFLRPPFLDESVKLSCHDPNVLKSVTRCRLHPRSKNGDTPTPPAAPPAAVSCPLLRAKQSDQTCPLRVRNLLSGFSPTFPSRDASRKGWLDSAFIDACLHIMQRHFPLREQLYIISAENDPDFDDLIRATRCYRYVLLILWRKAHWTLVWINMQCGEIWYFNSQIVSMKSVEEQLKPFREAFPSFHLTVGKTPQQSNGYDCGIYAAYISFCLLFAPDQIHNIDTMRTDMLRSYFVEQILVSLIL